MYCFPENLVIDGVVAVAESISHASDGSPFYLRIAGAQIIGQAFYCFPKDFQCPFQSQSRLPVGDQT